MPSQLRVEFNHDEFQRVLNSDGVKARIEQMVGNVAAQAGDGFKATMMQGHYGGSPRPVGVVRAETYEAKLAEARDKVLTSALGAARG